LQIAAAGISSSRQFPLSRQTLAGPFLHGMGLFCGQKLPPGTQKVAPGTELPRWAPSAWTKATFWHQTSTKSTSCVDKSHLLAPNFHKKHLLCGQAATFFLRVHKNAPACGQKSPTGTQKVALGTLLPRWAPPAWTGGNIFPPRPQKIPSAWTGGNICREADLVHDFCLLRY